MSSNFPGYVTVDTGSYSYAVPSASIYTIGSSSPSNELVMSFPDATGRIVGTLRVKEGRVTLEGNADESAQAFVYHAIAYWLPFQEQEKKRYRTEGINQALGVLRNLAGVLREKTCHDHSTLADACELCVTALGDFVNEDLLPTHGVSVCR